MRVPKVQLGIICGSSTNSLQFPGDLNYPGVKVNAKDLVFKTPFGDSPAFTHFCLGGKEILTCPMHGWRQGVTRADSSRQIFWVLAEAGVKRIIAEGGVGSVNHLLKPRDIVIPNDYLDFSMRKDVGLGTSYLMIMRQAICPEITAALYQAAKENPVGRNVFDRGVYVCTDGRHFESPAEVAMFKQLGGDIIGQSLCPEVYLAREIGVCYASVQLVVNYAEGIIKDWEHAELKDIYLNDAQEAGLMLLKAAAHLNVEAGCGCADLRKPTLLRDKPGQA